MHYFHLSFDKLGALKDTGMFFPCYSMWFNPEGFVIVFLLKLNMYASLRFISLTTNFHFIFLNFEVFQNKLCTVQESASKKKSVGGAKNVFAWGC